MTTKILKCPVCGHEFHGGPTMSPKVCDGFHRQWFGTGSLHPPTQTVEVSGKPSPLTGPYWR